MSKQIHSDTSEEAAETQEPIEAARRGFLSTLALGSVGAALLSSSQPARAQTLSDADIMNFALNLEHLGAEFYLRASTGQGLADSEVSGVGPLGPVAGGRQVSFASQMVANIANEIAADERGHVRGVRAALGSAAIARPAIDLSLAFTFAARGAGLVGQDATFDPYADDVSFLLAGFIFEDVCVTALKGAAPLLRDPTNVANAAGLLGAEGHHAAALRVLLIERGRFGEGQAISNSRNALNPGTFSDQGLGDARTSNITPVDANGLAYGRTPQQVLNIAYLNAGGRPTGFFPAGVNGTIR